MSFALFLYYEFQTSIIQIEFIVPCFAIIFYVLVCLIQADVDNSGTIDYKEFIAATLHLNKIEREDHLFAAFSYFDKDESGFITPDELQQACEEFGVEDARIEEMMRDVDQDKVKKLLFTPSHIILKLHHILNNEEPLINALYHS